MMANRILYLLTIFLNMYFCLFYIKVPYITCMYMDHGSCIRIDLNAHNIFYIMAIFDGESMGLLFVTLRFRISVLKFK